MGDRFSYLRAIPKGFLIEHYLGLKVLSRNNLIKFTRYLYYIVFLDTLKLIFNTFIVLLYYFYTSYILYYSYTSYTLYYSYISYILLLILLITRLLFTSLINLLLLSYTSYTSSLLLLIIDIFIT